MSPLRFALLMLEVVGMHITSTPPNPSLPRTQHIVPDWREKFLKDLAVPCILLRMIFWLTILVEAIIIITCRLPSVCASRQVSIVLSAKPVCSTNIRVTLVSFFGSLITFLGGMLRLKCYQALGPLFTFELSIHPNHRLVTHGPYALVRHPSYTGMIMTIGGVICSHSASGSWLTESGMLHLYLGRILASVWVTIAVCVVISLLLRISKEDELLKKEFGGEWVDWAEKVPCSLVPGLY